MNRLTIAVILLCLLIGLAIFGSICVGNAVHSFSAAITEIRFELLSGGYPAAYSSAQAVLEQFRQKEPLLALFIKRDFLNNLGINLAGLTDYAQVESRHDLLMELSRAEAQLHALQQLFFSLV